MGTIRSYGPARSHGPARMSAHRCRRRAKATKPTAHSLAKQVQVTRDKLFKATSIVACCRLACASLLAQGGDLEVMADALQAAHDLIDESAGQLGVICDEDRRDTREGRPNL